MPDNITTASNPPTQRGKRAVNPDLLRQPGEQPPCSLAAPQLPPNLDFNNNSTQRSRFSDNRLYNRWKELNKVASGSHAKRVLGNVLHSLSHPRPSSSSTSDSRERLDRNPAPAGAPSEMLTMQAASLSMPQTTHPRGDIALARADSSILGRGRSNSGFISNNSSTVSLGTVSKVGVDVEKPVCSGNGVSVSIILAEPTIYLTGIDHSEGANRDTATGSAILRGKLQLNITKSVKIKSVTLKFTGRARTEWPEGKNDEV